MKPIIAGFTALTVALTLASTVTSAEQRPLQLVVLGGEPGPFNPTGLPPYLPL
jgi:hypothetical protein